MKRRCTEEPMIRILPEAAMVGTVREVCRQHTIPEQTLSRWRRKCGGLPVSDAKRLRALEREHAALKRVVGARSFDNRRLRDVLGKKWGAWLPSALPHSLATPPTA